MEAEEGDRKEEVGVSLAVEAEEVGVVALAEEGEEAEVTEDREEVNVVAEAEGGYIDWKELRGVEVPN